MLSNFDIYAAAGANYKAVVREFTATANTSGQIVINFTTVTDNATIEGIEILALTHQHPAHHRDGGRRDAQSGGGHHDGACRCSAPTTAARRT